MRLLDQACHSIVSAPTVSGVRGCGSQWQHRIPCLATLRGSALSSCRTQGLHVVRPRLHLLRTDACRGQASGVTRAQSSTAVAPVQDNSSSSGLCSISHWRPACMRSNAGHLCPWSAHSCCADALETVVLDVRNMKCGGCTASVKRILLASPGVEKAAVNLLTECAVVKLHPGQSSPGAAAELLTSKACSPGPALLLLTWRRTLQLLTFPCAACAFKVRLMCCLQ